jgi:enoyl-CoA hydratase/carnithine racemase
MTDHIVTMLNGGIQQVRINRPEKKNALTSAMYSALAHAIERAERDETIRVTTITGTGDSFSSGNDVMDFLQQDKPVSERPVGRFLHVISSATKPLIAGVNGMAVGIGATMLLHCDLVYAADTATFQFPFVNLGLVPEAGSSMLLPRLIGYHRAAELMLTGDRFTASTAFDVGLINAVVPQDRLESLVLDRAGSLATKPLPSILSTKALLKTSAESVSARIAAESTEFARLSHTPESRRIMEAFLARHKAG